MTAPKTLGEYHDWCALVGHQRAVEFFDNKIKTQGRDQPVLADENQMLVLIGSLLNDDGEKK